MSILQALAPHDIKGQKMKEFVFYGENEHSVPGPPLQHERDPSFDFDGTNQIYIVLL